MTFLDQFISASHDNLLHSITGAAYLKSRGSSEHQWDQYGIGFTPNQFEFDVRSCAMHDDTCHTDPCDACRFIEWSGYRGSGGSNISESVVYPLTGYSGKAYGVQIRSIHRKRYDTFVLKRRPESVFFGLGPSSFRIFNTRTVMLCEGPSDMLVLQRLVYPDVLALTTNSVNLLQQLFLDRFVDTVFLVLDLDKPGRDGAESIINRNMGKNVFNVRYPKQDGLIKDPGDLWKSLGDIRFSTLLKREIKL